MIHSLLLLNIPLHKQDIDAGEIVNSALAATMLNGVVISDWSTDPDPNAPVGNDVPTVTKIIRTPELTVTKDDQLDYIQQNLQVGDEITYQIIVTNSGNVTLNNIVLTDDNANFTGSSTITQLLPGEFVTLEAIHVS